MTVTHKNKLRSTVRETWVVVAIVIVALTLLLYPAGATLWNNYRQHQVAEAYSHDVEQSPQTQLHDIVRRAEEYNARNTAGPIIDPWSARVSKDNAVYQEYLRELNTLDVMSEVTIPSINVKLPIYHGTSDEVLSKGAGHLFGTALPVGGDNTHAVITGHTGMQDATMFDNLDKMAVGDAIYLNTYGKKLKYEVNSIEVVLPEETDSLWPKQGQDLLTLITCTPYGVNSHRLLVHANRVAMDEETIPDESVSLFTMPWWMIAFIVIAIIVIELLILYIYKTHKRVKRWNEQYSAQTDQYSVA